ncbi:MAG: glycosyl hydrolase family 67 [Chitinivibrionales bacterium]|nr:glycosyl hydrolase family 67 [Chitinivibrionales bacterium]MBD3394122.1 glycosyl hydrolase family 67 [Chitinivibrionales bacterium]
MTDTLQYYIIDGIAPFFSAIDTRDGETLNWSKVPFARLEKEDRLSPEIAGRVAARFEEYTDRAASLGFNCITLDDVAHLVCLDMYPRELCEKISDYQRLYSRLIRAARDRGMTVLVTTDLMFFNHHIEAHTSMRDGPTVHLMATTLRRLFKAFPGIGGVVIRLGESDGIDVAGDFRSRLVIRTPAQCRRYIRGLLPLFEKYDRLMVVRTWSLGAYRIGDLMWNPRTYDKVFGGVVSRHLIVSHKFGDTDFYRYLKLNNLFFEGQHQKIVELQARREYEGFGEFPSFTGFDYEGYRRTLEECRDLAGISVWCQTGGWSRFRRLSFLPSSSLWNEINAYVTIKIFRDRLSALEAIAEFCREKLPGKDPRKLIRLLSLSDTLVKELWYLPEFSRQRLYFRRLRVPPLLWIFWDTIVVNHTIRKVLRRLVRRRREAIREGYQALYKIREMRGLAGDLGIDQSMFDFQYDTFRLVATAREYFLGQWSAELGERIERMAHEYRNRYPNGFVIEHDFAPVRIKKRVIKAIFKLCLRRRPDYRTADSLFLLRLTGWFYPLVRVWERRRMPEFVQKQAMGIQVLFK